MSTTSSSVHAEQLDSQQLAHIARAHWRELKTQLPDSPNKNSMEAIISELTYRTENDPNGGRQFAKPYQQFGGGSQQRDQVGSGSSGSGGVPNVN